MQMCEDLLCACLTAGTMSKDRLNEYAPLGEVRACQSRVKNMVN